MFINEILPALGEQHGYKAMYLKGHLKGLRDDTGNGAAFDSSALPRMCSCP